MTESKQRSNLSINLLITVVVLAVTLLAAEFALRLYNSSMKNYDIEMWRYGKTLKYSSANPQLGHEHYPNREAVLQSVRIRTNNLGMRGPDVSVTPAPGVRRILALGDSVTLGWGVPEEEVVTTRLQKMFDADGIKAEVLNAGIGNYNTVRSVELFLEKQTKLKPTDILLNYFVNDAEVLAPGGGNWLLRHSQLAVTVWIVYTRYTNPRTANALRDYYREIYDDNAPGWRASVAAIEKLTAYCKENNIRLYISMTPDIHNLKDYFLGFIHEKLRRESERLGVTYIDVLPLMRDLVPETVWAMAGDPHPNGEGHKRMAEAIYPVLKRPELGIIRK